MPGVTSAGFVRKLESEIIAEMVAEGQANIDPDFTDAPDTVTGQIVGIMGSKHAEGWEVLEAVYNALSEAGSGVQLDRIAALTNSFRRPDESDAAFRIRRREELADAGATTAPAMRAALSKLTGMQAARVISNRSILTDSAGRPPKSVEALVLGSATEASIAQTIWENLAAGIETYGANAESGEGLVISSVTDSEGESQTVMYSVAQPRSPYLRLTVRIDPGSYAGDAALKQRIIDFTSGALNLETTNGLLIAGGVALGGTVYASRIIAAALTVSGVVAVAQVQQKGTEAGTYATSDYALGPREYLGADGVRGYEEDHIEIVRMSP
jgi:hypothetical protein